LLILTIFTLVFLFKQAFGIPGAVLLNIFAGAMWGTKALLLSNLLGATGSTIQYLLSKHLLGQGLINKCVPKTALTSFKQTIESNSDNLFLYMVLIRILPLLPGWFVNLAAPHVGIPILLFWTCTFLGTFM
jgi:uncharacterized membrane protein YdjX (TVP38/TMEM64 family)